MPKPSPDMAAILALLATQPSAPVETLSPAEARRQHAQRSELWNQSPPHLAIVRDFAIGDIPARLYCPAEDGEPWPTTLYLHGGGWVIGSIETHDGLCRRLALAGDMAVVSLGYRLAPEHRFPAAVEDCLEAWRWLRTEGATLGLDATRLAIAGDSAGANLALATCLALRDAGAVLPAAVGSLYGAFSLDFDTPSHAAFGDGRYILSTAGIRWFTDQYTASPADRRSPLLAPLNGDLGGLPPIHLIVSELDPLRDDSDRLARRLIEVGTEFDYRLWRGVTHGCATMGRMLPEAEAMIREVGRFLRGRLDLAYLGKEEDA